MLFSCILYIKKLITHRFLQINKYSLANLRDREYLYLLIKYPDLENNYSHGISVAYMHKNLTAIFDIFLNLNFYSFHLKV